MRRKIGAFPKNSVSTADSFPWRQEALRRRSTYCRSFSILPTLMLRDVAARASAAASLLDTAREARTWANVARLCGGVAYRPLARLEPPAPVAAQDQRPLTIVVFEGLVLAAEVADRRGVAPAVALQAFMQVGLRQVVGPSVAVERAEEAAIET